MGWEGEGLSPYSWPHLQPALRGEAAVPAYRLFYFTEVYLIYNIVLASGVEQSDSVIHIYIFFLRFFSLLSCYKTLSGVPCATQEALVDYLFYMKLYAL